MGLKSKLLISGMLASGLALTVAPAYAQDRKASIKIGVLSDMTGAYREAVGPGSVIAAKMAVADFGGKVRDLPITVISADMLNKVDVATSIAREWIDTQGVDVIVDVPISSGTLAVNSLVQERDKILFSAAGTTDLSGKECNGHSVQWVWDNYAMAAALTNALLAEGGSKWFYFTADYTFGHDLQGMSADIVQEKGGTVLKSVNMPLGTTDQSSAVLEAAGSGAQVIGLANGGTDTQNSIKQMNEFGIGAKTGLKVAAFVLSQADVHAAGLPSTQGLYVPMPFYWTMNDKTLAWSKRFMQLSGGKPPSYQQAGVYSEVTHYLKAVQVAASTGGKDVMAKMREMPIQDDLFGSGSLRRDGRVTFPMYLFQVKSPGESTGEWDTLKLIREVSAAETLRPLGATGCTQTVAN